MVNSMDMPRQSLTEQLHGRRIDCAFRGPEIGKIIMVIDGNMFAFDIRDGDPVKGAVKKDYINTYLMDTEDPTKFKPGLLNHPVNVFCSNEYVQKVEQNVDFVKANSLGIVDDITRFTFVSGKYADFSFKTGDFLPAPNENDKIIQINPNGALKNNDLMLVPKDAIAELLKNIQGK